MIDYTAKRPTAVCDTECFPNYWSIAFECVATGRLRSFELFHGHPLDRAGIANILRKWRVVGFNFIRYDIPMICLAMTNGVTNEQLKRASDELILTGIPHWKWMKNMGLEVPDFIDAIDLMEVNPGAAQKPSLKICGGRLHSRRMQDLPYDPSQMIGPAEREVVRSYHVNDLGTTKDMWWELEPQIDLRAAMSVEYGIDLRSKSDAQIAEAVIKTEIERLSGNRVYKPEIRPGIFNYEPPKWVGFQSQMMREMLHEIRKTQFVIDDGGIVQMPKYLSDKKIELGSSIYRMGIGGLHSSEESVCHESDDEHLLLDRDVTSYYPNIIIQNRLVPKHLGADFLKVYERIYARRIAAKRKGDKTVAEALKITLNGSFGKLGSPYSVLYAPNLMIQTTLTGQLAILMLIERLELQGVQVVSANTDGIVSKVRRSARDAFIDCVWAWEDITGFGTEETEYSGLYSRDVNTYVAVKPGGKFKTKGAVGPCGPDLPAAMGLKKNPNAEIASEAAVNFLAKRVPIEKTINECSDIRKFVTVRRVTGGAHIDGEPIGKAIRWYISTSRTGPLQYLKDNKNVPRSEGAMPLMELPVDNACPADLDREFYIREAYAILQDLGYGTIDPALVGRAGAFFGRLPSQKTIHKVEASTGIALCGKERASIREAWIEFASVPIWQRLCSKCRKESEL